MIQPNPKKKIVKKKTNNPYEGQKDAFGNPVYGEGTNPPFTRKERSKMPRVGNMGSAKNGKSFPDLNKDGKITRADILKGRGVIAKKGATIKKAQMGSIVNKKVGNYASTKENIDRGFNNKSIKSKDKDYKVKLKVKNDGSVKATERRTLKGFLTGAPKAGGKLMKSGGSMKSKGPKKAALGALLPLAMKALPMVAGMLGGKKKKNGGSMKKCKYGCK